MLPAVFEPTMLQNRLLTSVFTGPLASRVVGAAEIARLQNGAFPHHVETPFLLRSSNPNKTPRRRAVPEGLATITPPQRAQETCTIYL